MSYSAVAAGTMVLALGDLALEQGHYSTARWYWERISPRLRLDDGRPVWYAVAGLDFQEHWEAIQTQLEQSDADQLWLAYPDTDLDLADVRADWRWRRCWRERCHVPSSKSKFSSNCTATPLDIWPAARATTARRFPLCWSPLANGLPAATVKIGQRSPEHRYARVISRRKSTCRHNRPGDYGMRR